MNSSEVLYQGCAYVNCVKMVQLIQSSSQVCLQNRNNKWESNNHEKLCEVHSDMSSHNVNHVNLNILFSIVQLEQRYNVDRLLNLKVGHMGYFVGSAWK